MPHVWFANMGLGLDARACNFGDAWNGLRCALAELRYSFKGALSKAQP